MPTYTFKLKHTVRHKCSSIPLSTFRLIFLIAKKLIGQSVDKSKRICDSIQALRNACLSKADLSEALLQLKKKNYFNTAESRK